MCLSFELFFFFDILLYFWVAQQFKIIMIAKFKLYFIYFRLITQRLCTFTNENVEENYLKFLYNVAN